MKRTKAENLSLRLKCLSVFIMCYALALPQVATASYKCKVEKSGRPIFSESCEDLDSDVLVTLCTGTTCVAKKDEIKSPVDFSCPKKSPGTPTAFCYESHEGLPPILNEIAISEANRTINWASLKPFSKNSYAIALNPEASVRQFFAEAENGSKTEAVFHVFLGRSSKSHICSLSLRALKNFLGSTKSKPKRCSDIANFGQVTRPIQMHYSTPTSSQSGDSGHTSSGPIEQ